MRSLRAHREIRHFAAAMLRTMNLPKNVAKGPIGNQEAPLHVYRKHYEEERREIVEACDQFYHAGPDREAQIAALKRIEEESVDAANVAMLCHSEARRLREGLS